jgi:hypothetical protein
VILVKSAGENIKSWKGENKEFETDSNNRTFKRNV